MPDCSVKIWRPQKWYRRASWQMPALMLVVALCIGQAAMHFSAPSSPVTVKPIIVEVIRPGSSGAVQVSNTGPAFTKCRSSTSSDCVVDGDTFRYQGDIIRIADIDAPETRDAKCAVEAQLGAQATARLARLLNQGEFQLDRYETRDRDRYGRLLRVVSRNGSSIGNIVVAEGLARRWEGRRRPWC